jgi:hypothetical protein
MDIVGSPLELYAEKTVYRLLVVASAAIIERQYNKEGWRTYYTSITD